jgi:hypothetical protein
VAETPSADIPPEQVEQRLRELAQLHELGMALRDVRFIDPQIPDRVREQPGTDDRRPRGGGGNGEAPEDRPTR